MDAGGARHAGRLLAAAGLGVLVLLTTACGERAEPTGTAAQLYPLTVASGQSPPLTVRAPKRRIAFLARGPLEIVRAIGAGGSIAGLPIDRNGTLLPRRLRALHADLVVGGPNTDEVDLARAARLAGAP